MRLNELRLASRLFCRITFCRLALWLEREPQQLQRRWRPASLLLM